MKHKTRVIIDWGIPKNHVLSDTLKQLEHLIWDSLREEDTYSFITKWQFRKDGFHLDSVEGYIAGYPWKIQLLLISLSLTTNDICYRWYRSHTGYVYMRNIHEDQDSFLNGMCGDPTVMNDKHQQDALNLLEMIVRRTKEAYS